MLTSYRRFEPLQQISLSTVKYITGEKFMKLPQNAYVAIVDGENFTLMQNTGQPFSPSLEKVSKPDLDPTNFSAGVRHQDDAGQKTGNTDLNELAHGAAAAEWLNSKAIEGKFEHIAIIADPKTLGEMRRHYHTELKSRLIGEIAKTLTGEPTERIEKAISAA
jgi:protein required for attachment to host cells